MKNYPPDMPWAIVQIKKLLFAIATQDLREMVLMPEAARVPNMPDFVRGVINLRGRVLPLLDLRKRIGLPSVQEESEKFCELMQQRERDHRNWLNELEASVQQRRAFTLTTDPHKCAFGKWYDTYHADNPWVAALLQRFNVPHQRIHGVGVDVEKRMAVQDYEGAEQLVQRAREGVLGDMLRLFAGLRDLVRETGRETAVILMHEQACFAVSVDLAVSIERFPPANIEELPPAAAVNRNGVVGRLGKRAKGSEIVLMIETGRLLAGCEMGALATPEAPVLAA